MTEKKETAPPEAAREPVRKPVAKPAKKPMCSSIEDWVAEEKRMAAITPEK